MDESLFSYRFKEIALNYLREALKNPEAQFKEDQLDAILSIVRDRKKVLLVQKTGWGKSMVYFISSKILRDPNYYRLHLNQENKSPGPCLMISPLLSLMRNQVHYGSNIINLDRIDSSQSIKSKSEAESSFLNNNLDLLIVAPERLSNPDFVENVLAPIASKIGLLIVDEAHCISDWGHDFRPDYMRINSIIDNLPPRTPLVATTATANDRVINDIHSRFGDDTEIIRGELGRSSLKLMAKMMPSETERLAFIASNIPNFGGSGIIYALTIRNAEKISLWLQKNGINARPYHANMKDDDRVEVENKLLNDELDVVVATSALGMGFDKPNLKFVIHFQTPQSAVHYYQQVGRTGRNIKDAYGICLLGQEDEEINSFFIENAFPSKNIFELIINVLSKSDKPMDEHTIKYLCNVPPGQIEKALKILDSLDSSPIIQIKKRVWQKTPNTLSIDWDKVEEIKKTRIREWEDMKEYIKLPSCRMVYLSNILGDNIIHPCGKCNNCSTIDIQESNSDLIQKASIFLNKLNIPIMPRKLWMKPDFKIYKHLSGSIKDNEKAMEGRALCHISDMHFGKMVLEGKTKSEFNDELIDAAMKIINDKNRWQAKDISFSWVTCVPSLNKKNLVPDFAKKIALRLKIPFVEAVLKIKETKPQKTMNSSKFKKENLDGAFAINKDLIPNSGNVLLIDDIVESGWTYTVISALLRLEGAGDIYPFALAYRKGDAVIDKYIEND